jgi:hypothetical protein
LASARTRRRRKPPILDRARRLLSDTEREVASLSPLSNITPIQPAQVLEDRATPSQANVGDAARALGVTDRWEYDPASSDDWPHDGKKKP